MASVTTMPRRGQGLTRADLAAFPDDGWRCNVKRARFEEAGCASFWLVDPLEPRLTAWQLDDGRYREVADVSGEDSWTASAPFAVTITPSGLVD